MDTNSFFPELPFQTSKASNKPWRPTGEPLTCDIEATSSSSSSWCCFNPPFQCGEVQFIITLHKTCFPFTRVCQYVTQTQQIGLLPFFSSLVPVLTAKPSASSKPTNAELMASMHRGAVDRWTFTHRGSYQHFSDVLITPIMMILKYNEGNIYIYKNKKLFFLCPEFMFSAPLRYVLFAPNLSMISVPGRGFAKPTSTIRHHRRSIYIYIRTHNIYVHMYMTVYVYNCIYIYIAY